MSVPRIIRLRWSAGNVPAAGCRRCGYHPSAHPRMAGIGLHGYEAPTEAQRLARAGARRRYQR